MSILMHMEMPEDCFGCILQGSPICIEHLDFSARGKRPEQCPLIAVPTPHGRLIDEQWLNMQIHTAKEIHTNEKHDFCNAFDSNGRVCTEWWCVEDMIDNAPTIIEAEESE